MKHHISAFTLALLLAVAASAAVPGTESGITGPIVVPTFPTDSNVIQPFMKLPVLEIASCHDPEQDPIIVGPRPPCNDSTTPGSSEPEVAQTMRDPQQAPTIVGPPPPVAVASCHDPEQDPIIVGPRPPVCTDSTTPDSGDPESKA